MMRYGTLWFGVVACLALAACGGKSSPPSFTLGGSIAGLTTAGLVLANGGETVSPPANTTSFTFGTSIASGTSYTVSVAAQPTGATCVVSNGTGTISANVSNVQVACTPNTYKVGGTLTGLTASGLVLANGADAVSPAPNASSFVFPTAVPSGVGYAVTVKTQPATQTCTVSAGAGTVAAADVASVQVACTTNTFVIGGTITGLTASGLVLDDNGGDALSVPSGATAFSFATRVPAGAAYAVTVATPPTGQTCSITNGSGTVVSANVTTVQIACTTPSVRQWRTPAQIQTTAGASIAPQAVIDANGNVLAVWTTETNTGSALWANRYDAAAGAWGTARAVSSTTDWVQRFQYSLAVDRNGNALAVWTQEPGVNVTTAPAAIMASRYDAGTGTWSAAQVIGGDAPGTSALIAQNPSYPRVAFDANGNAVAAWVQNDSTTNVTRNVWAARFTAGTGWSAARAITTGNDAVSGQTRVAFDASGGAVVAYAGNVSGGFNLRAVRLAAGSSTWTAPTVVSTNGSSTAGLQLSLATDGLGQLVAAYVVTDANGSSLWVNRFSAGAWGTAQRVDTGATPTANEPQVAGDAAGNATVIWSDSSGVFTNRFSAGTWGAPQSLNAAGGRRPQLAFDAAGNAVAVWDGGVGGIANIWSARYTVGAGWGPGVKIESALGVSSDAQVVVDGSGNATALWDEMEPSPGVNAFIWANRYQ